MNPLSQVFQFALLPAIAMMTGGGIALWRPPNAVWHSAILHFAAGVVFSVVAVELLPDIVKEHLPLEVGLGFGSGVTLLHNLRGEALELVLSFGLAALLFLVTEELLVEAHEEAETPLLTATFFGGFLLFLLLGMAG